MFCLLLKFEFLFSLVKAKKNLEKEKRMGKISKLFFVKINKQKKSWNWKCVQRYSGWNNVDSLALVSDGENFSLKGSDPVAKIGCGLYRWSGA